MKTEVASKRQAGRNGETQRQRNKPKFRLFRSPQGKIQKLYINGRIERVNLGHDVDPETCSFLPILNQIVVISNVEPGVRCYAKPLNCEEKGYKILTFPDEEVVDNDEADNRLNLTKNAIKGMTFSECALNCADVREKYLRNLRVQNPNIASSEQITSPKLFIRYGEQAALKGER